MNKFQELKSSFEQTNKKWEARINAVENQLQLSKEKAIDRAEEMKRKYEERLDDLSLKFDNVKDYNEEKKNTLKGKIENLKVQLALGKMDTKAKYQENKKKIRDAINSFDARMESDYDLATEELAKEWPRNTIENGSRLPWAREDPEPASETSISSTSTTFDDPGWSRNFSPRCSENDDLFRVSSIFCAPHLRMRAHRHYRANKAAVSRVNATGRDGVLIDYLRRKRRRGHRQGQD